MSKELTKKDNFVSQGEKEYGHNLPIFTSRFLKDAKIGNALSKEPILKVMYVLTFYAPLWIGLGIVMPLFNGGYIYIIGLICLYILMIPAHHYINRSNHVFEYGYAYFSYDYQSYLRTMDNLDTIIHRLEEIEKIKDREKRETAYYRYVMELDQIYGKGHHLLSASPKLIEEEKRKKENEWDEEVKRRKEVEKNNFCNANVWNTEPNCCDEMKPYVIQAMMEYKEALKVLEDLTKDLGFQAEVNIRTNAKIEKEQPRQLKAYQYSKDKKLKKKMDPYNLFPYDPDWEDKIRKDIKLRSMQEEVDPYVRLIRNILDDFRNKFWEYNELPNWDDKYRDYRRVTSVIDSIISRLSLVYCKGYREFFSGTDKEHLNSVVIEYEIFGRLGLVHPEISALQYSSAKYNKEKIERDKKKEEERKAKRRKN